MTSQLYEAIIISNMIFLNWISASTTGNISWISMKNNGIMKMIENGRFRAKPFPGLILLWEIFSLSQKTNVEPRHHATRGYK